VRLDPLPTEEAADYLLHQVRIAGGRPDMLLAEEAVVLLARATNGVPRRLNQAAHEAFRLAHEAGAPQVDVEAAMEALALLGMEVEETDAPSATEPALQEDCGPLLSLADPIADPGDADDSERLIQPKRPA